MISYRNSCGQFHRDGDLPAIEHRDGSKEWWINGQRCRLNDLPAIVYSNGNKWWCINGKFGRANDLPVIEYANGQKEWKRKNKFMSDDIQVKMDNVLNELVDTFIPQQCDNFDTLLNKLWYWIGKILTIINITNFMIFLTLIFFNYSEFYFIIFFCDLILNFIL